MATRELRIKPDPDFERLRRVLCREGEPDRVPFFEIHGQVEDQVLRALGEPEFVYPQDPATRAGIRLCEDEASSRSQEEDFELTCRQHIAYMHALGYDYVNVIPPFKFPSTRAQAEDGRRYVQTHLHEIENWNDFEKYPWPEMSQIDYTRLDWVEDRLPEGMKVVVHEEGPYIKALYLLGYMGLSYLLQDDRSLVRAVFDEIGKRLLEYFDTCASFDSIGAMLCADDIAYRTGTVLSPDDLREFAFPWHKKIVEAIHNRGKPVILHACGNVEVVMPDIIECGYDARHSFEDVITPVWVAKERWGDRVAMLGGFDMHKLCTMTPDEVRRHTKFLIEQCAPGGGWALGTGNSVANYVPVENFLAMLEVGFNANQE